MVRIFMVQGITFLKPDAINAQILAFAVERSDSKICLIFYSALQMDVYFCQIYFQKYAESG
jgi:hypothetical protein